MAEPNPYEGLRSAAQNRVFKIDEQVATDAVKIIADAMDIIEFAAGDFKADAPGGQLSQGEQAAYDQLYKDIKTVDHFGNLGSGKTLSKAFQDLGIELMDTTLPAFKKSLRDLAEAFIIAGGMVENQEDTSESVFNALKNESAAAGEVHHVGMRRHGDRYISNDPVIPTNVGGESYSGRPLDAKAPGMRSINTFLEPAASLTYPVANSLRNSLEGRINGLTMLAGEWQRMADRLTIGFNNMARGMTGLTESRWRGDSAEQGMGAVNRYSAAAGQLTTAMNHVGTLLENASAWMSKFYAELPDAPVAASDTAENQAVTRAQAAFTAWYAPGVTASSVLPELPGPTGIQGQNPGPRETVPTGNPTGNPTSPTGSPSPNQLQPAFTPVSQNQPNAQLAQLQSQASQQGKALRDLAAQQAAAQQAAQQAAAQQSAQQAVQQAAQQAQQALQQGLQGAQQAIQEGLQGAQQNMQPAGLAGLPGSLSDLQKDLAKKGGGGGAGKGAGGGGGGGGGLPGGANPKDLAATSKLFPRASLPTTTGMEAARAGIAATPGMPGAPGAMGAAGQGANQGQKEYKRADYLDSVEHLEEALGEAPIVVKPVVEK
ncbi:hypothetical protein REK76_03925 [Nocardia farcinica]|uniref:hypothetical protein n=1 Tax=Nocardia farcinica TaxID=37329 RepID=UPI00311DDFA6